MHQPVGKASNKFPHANAIIQVDFRTLGYECFRGVPDRNGPTDGVGDVARTASKRNSNALDGMCRLKSTRLCISSAQQAAKAPTCRAMSTGPLPVLRRPNPSLKNNH